MFGLFKKKIDLKTLATEFASGLKRLDYFSAIGNNQEIMDRFVETYLEYQTFTPVLNEEIADDKIISLDKRSFYCESVRLYEIDFFKTFIERIQPSLESFNIPFKVENISGGWNAEKLSYNLAVSINETNYILLTDFHTGPLGYAVYQIAEMMNDIFMKNNSANKVYLTGYGEIIAWYFLTKEQHEYISNHYEKSENKPLELKEWYKNAEKNQMVFFKNT